MNWGKVLITAWVTFAFIIFTGLLFGFSQMGDCYPEPSALKKCLAAKDRAGDVVLVSSAVFYFLIVYFIFRKRKAH